MPLALFALGLTIFGLGTTEFMIAGLLPELATAFGVSVPDAGLLISLFAVGVVIGAPTMTVLTSRVPRKLTLVTLLVVFLVGEVLAAVAPTFGVLMTTRVVTAVAHGAFFGIGAVVAADLVTPDKRARAIAIMFGGLTIATVAGVPMGTFIGQQLGWRATFWAVAIVGAIGLAGVIALVPAQPRGEVQQFGRELTAFRSSRLWLALATTTLSQAALYSAYTYIAPLVTTITGFSNTAVAPLLMLYGVGTVLGSWLGGKLADRNLMRTLAGGLVVLGGILALFTPTAHSKITMVLTLAVFGVASFVINPALQTRVMNVSPDAPTLASAVNISAFNVGNALGPWLAGLAISSGAGFLAPSWVGAALAVGSIATALASITADRRKNSPRTPAVTVAA